MTLFNEGKDMDRKQCHSLTPPTNRKGGCRTGDVYAVAV